MAFRYTELLCDVYGGDGGGEPASENYSFNIYTRLANLIFCQTKQELAKPLFDYPLSFRFVFKEKTDLS